MGLGARVALQDQIGARAIGRRFEHLVAIQKLHAQARAGLRQAVRVFVDIAGGITLGEIAAVVLALQRGFNRAHLVWRDRAARQATSGQHGGHLAGVVKARLVAVDVQDAFALVVEVNAFLLGPAKQVLTRGNGQARGGFGVVAVLGYRRHKLGHPAQLVPGGRGVHQERSVLGEHPLQAFDDGAGVGPDLGIRR